ncbi:MAG TPA: hypothetical protein VGM53_35125 [Streptosporangiaceae bacterium]|jgi:hypothetical protein
MTGAQHYRAADADLRAAQQYPPGSPEHAALVDSAAVHARQAATAAQMAALLKLPFSQQAAWQDALSTSADEPGTIQGTTEPA